MAKILAGPGQDENALILTEVSDDDAKIFRAMGWEYQSDIETDSVESAECWVRKRE